MLQSHECMDGLRHVAETKRTLPVQQTTGTLYMHVGIDEGTYDLHFVELNDMSTTLADSHGSSLEQPQQASPTQDRSRQSQATYERDDAARRLYSIEHLRESDWEERTSWSGGVLVVLRYATPEGSGSRAAERSAPAPCQREGVPLRRGRGEPASTHRVARRATSESVGTSFKDAFYVSILPLGARRVRLRRRRCEDQRTAWTSWMWRGFPPSGSPKPRPLNRRNCTATFIFRSTSKAIIVRRQPISWRHLRDRRRAYRELHLH